MLQQDFCLSSNGDIVIEENNIKLIEGKQVYIQAFQQILRTRLGEYFLNLNEGFDFDVFLGKKVIDEEEAMSALQSAGLQVEEFVKFTSITYTFNKNTRVLSVVFEALFSDGSEISDELEVVFGG